jgi:Domain of unknown function (DUF1844)
VSTERPNSPAAEHDGGAEPGGIQSGGAEPGGPEVRELATIPAVEVITRASVMLMSAAAEKLGLAEDGERYLDLDEARRLIEAYAGLLGAAQADLGVHRQPLVSGLRSLQQAFRDASSYPDQPGHGPGESPASDTLP